MTRVPQPNDVYGPGSDYATFTKELDRGCPPYWGDADDMDYRAVGDRPWATVGEAHAEARRGANRTRSITSAHRALAQRIGL